VTMLLSFVLQAAGLGLGTLAAIEPLLVLELPLTLIGARFFLGSRLGRREWSAIVVMTAGTSGLIGFLGPSRGPSRWHRVARLAHSHRGDGRPDLYRLLAGPPRLVAGPARGRAGHRRGNVLRVGSRPDQGDDTAVRQRRADRRADCMAALRDGCGGHSGDEAQGERE
jgi:hypothetical protein